MALVREPICLSSACALTLALRVNDLQSGVPDHQSPPLLPLLIHLSSFEVKIRIEKRAVSVARVRPGRVSDPKPRVVWWGSCPLA